MENKMEKRYGLFTAICMVVGIVIGSGVFYKASSVLKNTGGDMGQTLLTVFVVGVIMLICSNVFATLAARYEKINGIVDYAEASIGKSYSYYVAWFLTLIYYPTLTSCLAWVSAQYACLLLGWEIASMRHFWLGAAFLLIGGAINAYSPKLAGFVQTSTTVIKLIPLLLMAVVGTIFGILNGTTIDAFSEVVSSDIAQGSTGIMGAIVAFAFAYEGWIIATAINSELKESKKNLPKALIIGSIIVISVYLTYFIGLTGALSVSDMIKYGDDIPKYAFPALFGNIAGTVIMVFIVISCLGTMNGLMMGCARGAYSLATRNEGVAPKFFAKVDKKTAMATNSAYFGIFISIIWYLYWQFFFIEGKGPVFFNWEPDELPIITLYAAYIPIFIVLMKKGKELGKIKRFILPALGIVSCIFMVYCAMYAYRIQAIYYLLFFFVVTALGFIVRKYNGSKNKV